jgi:ATP-dependent Clp protease adaptor protein ClpS
LQLRKEKGYGMGPLTQQSGGQVETERPVRPILQLLPPYKVLLHNDDIHLFQEVIEALVRSVPVSTQEADAITWKAHIEGCAVVIVCNEEEAEYYKEHLETYWLTITIEPT